MAKPTRYTPEMFREYTSKGFWTSTTFAELWDRNAREYPNKEAVADSRTRLTWAQAKQWIDRMTLGFWELGFQRDDVIAIQLPNCVELCLLRVACEKAGIICMPLLRTLRHREVEQILSQVKAAGVIIPSEFRDFDYVQMVKEIRPNLPKLKHVFIVGDTITEGTIPFIDIVQQPLEKKYPSDFVAGQGHAATEFTLVFHTTGTTGFPKFVEYPICRLDI